MYTELDLTSLVNTFEKYRAADYKLKLFLDPVASAINFDYTTAVYVTKDEVFFTAEWHGPYQATETETFRFPLLMLTQKPEAIASYLLQKMHKKNQVEKQAAVESLNERERLRNKFEITEGN